MSKLVFPVALIGAWCLHYMGALALNKYVLSKYNFKFIIVLTVCHMMVCPIVSYAAIAWMKLVPMHTFRWRTHLLTSGVLSFFFCTSAFVNVNLVLILRVLLFKQVLNATFSTYATLLLEAVSGATVLACELNFLWDSVEDSYER